MAFGFLKKIAKFALPVAGTILGGPLGGMAGGALGGVVSGGGLKGAALGGVGGLALGKLGGLKGVAGQLGKLGISPGQVAQLGLGGLTAIQGAKQSGKANQINQGVLAQLQAQEAERGKVRQQLLGRLTGPQAGREDLGGLFASENPFARGIRPTPTQTTGQMAPIPQVQGPTGFDPLAFQRQALSMPNRGRVQNRVGAVLQ